MISTRHCLRIKIRLTSCPWTSLVDTRAGDEHIVYNSENTLATDPGAIFMLDLAVIQDSGFVKVDAAPVDFFGKRDLIGMKILPAGLPSDLAWVIA